MFAFAMTVPSSLSGRQDGMTDTCIRKIAAGDQAALAELYEQTHAAVYSFALSILKNRQDAEDVVQDTYIQIWNAAGGYTSEGKPLAWIFTIARNLARMRIRAQSRTVAVAPEDWQSLFSDEPAVTPEDRLLLAALLETLSDEERQILVLHIMTGLKHREIAELLNLQLNTVLVKHSRALKKLRSVLKEANGNDGS